MKSGMWWTNFQYKDELLVNTKNGKAIDASPEAREGFQVYVANKSGQVQQQWKIVYIDQAPKYATEGFNEEFGFHINRPFYIRSRLPLKRVAECVGANNVVLRRWRANVAAQQWYFDGTSKTVKSN